MSQFDVHRNTGRSASEIPYVVIVQSAAFDKRKRRVVVPLVAVGNVKPPHSGVNPVFTIKGSKVVLHPFDMVSVSVGSLGELVGSLTDEGDTIIAALDELFSRAWG